MLLDPAPTEATADEIEEDEEEVEGVLAATFSEETVSVGLGGKRGADCDSALDTLGALELRLEVVPVTWFTEVAPAAAILERCIWAMKLLF
jgi:hypothetical protein